MAKRLLAFVGACGLVLAMAALMSMLPAYAGGSDCSGSYPTYTEDDHVFCDDKHMEDSTCEGTDCQCLQSSSSGGGCPCKN